MIEQTHNWRAAFWEHVHIPVLWLMERLNYPVWLYKISGWVHRRFLVANDHRVLDDHDRILRF